MDAKPEIRIADADRVHVTQRLQIAYAEGRIDTGELEERLASVHQARTKSDLTPILADLPPDPSVALEASSGARAPNWIRPWVGPFLAPPIICTIIWAITMPGGYFWPVWVWLGCLTPVLIAVLSGWGDDSEDD